LNDYYNEVLTRYQDGEVLNSDSIHLNDTVKYYTSKGRVVYGGGGIIPDVFVPLDTTLNGNSFLNAVLNQGLIQQFSYSWYQNHAGALNQYSSLDQYRREYAVSNDLFNEFLAYTIKNNVPGIEADEKASHNYVSVRIKAFLAREKFSPDSFYAIINDDDPAIHAALQSMNQDVTAFNWSKKH
jgi:carboxyl-terminal processing protease